MTRDLTRDIFPDAGVPPARPRPGEPADYDQGARERHGLGAGPAAGFERRDLKPDGPAVGGDIARPDLGGIDPWVETGDEADEEALSDYAETVGYLDRGADRAPPDPDPAADAADDDDHGPYSGLEGTGPQPGDGRNGQTNTSGLPTALARPTPRS